MIKGIAVIKNWSYRKGILYGEVFGHPRVQDGAQLNAGTVQDVVKEADDTYIVETEDMFYALVPPADKDRPFPFEARRASGA